MASRIIRELARPHVIHRLLRLISWGAVWSRAGRLWTTGVNLRELGVLESRVKVVEVVKR